MQLTNLPLTQLTTNIFLHPIFTKKVPNFYDPNYQPQLETELSNEKRQLPKQCNMCYKNCQNSTHHLTLVTCNCDITGRGSFWCNDCLENFDKCARCNHLSLIHI